MPRTRVKVPAISAVALALALLLTILSASALLWNLSRLRASQEKVSLSNVVLARAAELHEAIRAAETGQRGYLLTGEKRYLTTYEAGVPRVWESLKAAEVLVRDPQQVSSVASLRPVIQAKLDELQQTVALRARSLDAALQVVRSDLGQQLMEKIDATMRSIRERGAVLIEERTLREQRDTAWTTAAAALTGGLALVSAVLGATTLLAQRTRSRLFEAEERFRNLAENIPEVFRVSDPRTDTTLYVNPAFERVWDRPREALYRDGRVWLSAVVRRDRARVEESFTTWARESRYDETYQISRPDGTLRWIRDRGWPVRSEEGEFLYVVGIAEDITAMREAQEALGAINAELEQRVEERTQALVEVNRELDAFAYSISHDLRAPLRAMQGYADALVEDYGPDLPAEGKGYVRRIMASAGRMEHLIEDILAYSRLAQSEISVRSVSLSAIVDQVLTDNAEIIMSSEAEVEVVRPMASVLASPSVLRQVLSNLISNALKFVAPGERPKVKLWMQTSEEVVRLWIEDNGIGIALDHQDRIFEPFQRLHGIEHFPGTGIGLAIVRRAVVRMGGRCGVVSAAGQGSRFWIELPLTRQG